MFSNQLGQCGDVFDGFGVVCCCGGALRGDSAVLSLRSPSLVGESALLAEGLVLCVSRELEDA